jgi:hypothetical protein
MAMIAPMPDRLSRSTASATCSATSLSSIRRRKRVTRDCPRCASAARSSGWKITSAANAPYENTRPSMYVIIVSFMSHASTYTNTRTTMPMSICTARVPWMSRSTR